MLEPTRSAKLLALTPRQRQILALRCEGKTLAEIAQAIEREERTIKDHMGNIYEKLGLGSMQGNARALELAEYCRVLHGEPQAAPSPRNEPEPEPPVPTERALVAVMEDELAMVRRPAEIVVPWRGTPVGPPFEQRRRINPFLLLFATALGASLVSALAVGIVLTQTMGRETIIQQVPVPVTVAPPPPPIVQGSPVVAGDTGRTPTSPTARPEPTTRQLPPTSAPTPLPGPPPEPGTLLYVGDWGQGLSGWNASTEWKVLDNLLLNDGSRRIGCCVHSLKDAPTIRVPYRPPTRDYAAEAEMQTARTNWTVISSFGLMVRNNYAAGFNYDTLFMDVGDKRVKLPNFNPEQWHTYRLEATGNTVRFLVDGTLVGEAIDNRHLEPGQVGFWSFGVQTSIRSLKVLAL